MMAHKVEGVRLGRCDHAGPVLRAPGRASGTLAASMSSVQPQPPPPAGASGNGASFVRDRVTALAYTALAPYVFCLYGLGPILVSCTTSCACRTR
jgi:hypothetical protein